MTKPVAFVVPVLPGKTIALRALVTSLAGPKAKDFDEMEKRLATDREVWFLQSSPMGDLAIAYFECKDPVKTMRDFAASKHPFDLWFKAQMKEISGSDFNEESEGSPEQIFQYHS